MNMLRKVMPLVDPKERLARFRRPLLLAPGQFDDPTPSPAPVQAATTPQQAAPEAPAAPRTEPPTARCESVVNRSLVGPIADDARPRAIAISTHVMAITGDAVAGILLSQLIYWTRRGTEVIERGGWIFKTAREWQHETGMSWKVQRRARDHLARLGLVEERKQTMPARLEFRLDLRRLTSLLGKHADLEAGHLGLPEFTDREDPRIDQLLGWSFLYHGALAALMPVHAAMLCSRLLAASRLPIHRRHLDDARGLAWQLPTRPVAMHRAEWKVETGLSRDQWQTARRKLREAGLLIEQGHNYPRRVDLALNMPALAELLRQRQGRPAPSDGAATPTGSTPTPAEAGWNRAKQPAATDHGPNPANGSPDPTQADRPILPIAIARSCLYPSALQGSLPPPPQRAARASAIAFSSFGWGGWGGYGTEVQKPALKSDALASEPASDGTQALIWPSIFTDGDRAQAGTYLARLDGALRQQILDEIAWQQETGKAVRSPVALLRALCGKARDGSFVPDGAHRVAAARLKAIETERCRIAADIAKRDSKAKSAGSDPSPEVRQRLAALRAALGRKAAA